MQPGSDKQTLTYAKLLLRETKKSVREVAMRLLFASEEMFVNYFRKQTGMLPLAYRAQSTPALCDTGKTFNQTMQVEVVFPDRRERQHTLWLSQTYVPVTQDILSVTVDHAVVHWLDGDIVRVKRFDAIPRKSAVVCREFTGRMFYHKRLHFVHVHLDPQSNELTVTVDGLALFTHVSVTLTVELQGPR